MFANDLNVSISNISHLSEQCSQAMKSWSSHHNELERKILNVYLQNQLKASVGEFSDKESEISEDEDSNADSLEASFEELKQVLPQEIVRKETATPVFTRLAGTLEYKRTKRFLDHNKWRVNLKEVQPGSGQFPVQLRRWKKLPRFSEFQSAFFRTFLLRLEAGVRVF